MDIIEIDNNRNFKDNRSVNQFLLSLKINLFAKEQQIKDLFDLINQNFPNDSVVFCFVKNHGFISKFYKQKLIVTISDTEDSDRSFRMRKVLFITNFHTWFSAITKYHFKILFV